MTASPPQNAVDELRSQLRERGYLSHGIERWFALDPWSSRAFWLELAMVAAKGALIIALFALLPLAAVMLYRNHPLSAWETLLMALLYGAFAMAAAFAFLVIVALVLRLRPAIAIDTPPALLAISFLAGAMLTLPLAVWWFRFDAAPAVAELLSGLALLALFFLISTVVVSAALLTFSIYELQRVPAIHRAPRGRPMSVAAVILIAFLFLPAYVGGERPAAKEPAQVVTTPTSRRVAVVAVDGMTYDILSARIELADGFSAMTTLQPLRGDSTTERWASLGTGVPPEIHGVHSIEGIRLWRGSHLIQNLSGADVVLRQLAPTLGLASREPLPPTVRRRDYVWEIFAARGVPSVSVNWWTTEDSGRDSGGAIESVSQSALFAAARVAGHRPEVDVLRLDEAARKRFLAMLDGRHPRFATLYLPALDIVLNRLPLDRSTQLALSVRALDGIRSVRDEIRARGYELFLIGLPGDRQAGMAVLAASVPLRTTPPPSPLDIAPTLCALFGFPASEEMPGKPLVSAAEPRVASYGNRAPRSASARVDQEYYESLRSLGYIR